MKTTSKYFQYFKERCKHWQNVLGLLGWRIDYYHEDKRTDCYACFHAETNGRVASLTLSKTWSFTHPKDFDAMAQVDESALHECLELFLLPLKDRYSSRAVEGERTHTIIRTLEHVILSKKGEGK